MNKYSQEPKHAIRCVRMLGLWLGVVLVFCHHLEWVEMKGKGYCDHQLAKMKEPGWVQGKALLLTVD